MAPTNLPDGVQRVSTVLQSRGHATAPVMLEAAARTAQQAADALGVQLGQIAKSIIFKRVSDGAAVLVVTSGDRRVDQTKVEAQIGPLARADAAFVKEKTGFSIGGVSPVGHASPCVTLVDEDLFRFETVWAAAGHPHAVFAISPQDLSSLVDTIESDVVQAPLTGMPAAARKLLSDRCAAVCSAGSSFMSPCVSVCRMDEAAGLCLGCLRSIDEIIAWSKADDAGRMTMWRGIETRLQGVTA
jgi:prolyl-tRNA editing enzyme YbaK/EbsC (Cys-tRNA(Pro) deacylase)/predicted Fe-S protein YdhL (DUF1289 family)